MLVLTGIVLALHQALTAAPKLTVLNEATPSVTQQSPAMKRCGRDMARA